MWPCLLTGSGFARVGGDQLIHSRLDGEKEIRESHKGPQDLSIVGNEPHNWIPGLQLNDNRYGESNS